jgi:hypothetical protein
VAEQVLALAAALLVAGTILVFSTSGADAAGTSSGAAVPTDPTQNTPLTSGGSSTTWTLNLPAQASCSGDTASQGFHVYSYVVPSGVDPSTLTFNPASGPSQGFPLVDVSGSAYLANNTAAVTGQVIQIPNFNWNLFATTDQGGTKLALPPGDYNVGLACADTNGQGDRFWNVVLTFAASGSDPNGETWTTSTGPTSTTAPTSTSSSGGSTTTSSTSSSSSDSTTTTAVGGSTTSTVFPSGGDGSTSPTVLGSTTTSVAPLARTGASSVPVALAGGAASYVGVVILLLARRRRAAWM